MRIAFIFQLLAAAMALGFFINGAFKFFSGQQRQTIFKFATNSIVWLGILIFSLFPAATHIVSRKLGFGESLNTFIFIGFMIVFIILFKIINIIERTEKNISEIVRKEALSQLVTKQ